MKICLIAIALVVGYGLNAQDVTITKINDLTNPAHRDNIGSWEPGNTFKVEGTYSAETAASVTLRLLTFIKDTWVNPIDVHEKVLEGDAPFSGIIDSELTIPEDYTLGDVMNTQMLQVRIEFNGFDTSIHNFFLDIKKAKDPGDPQDPQGSLFDFDAVYGQSVGSTLVNNINDAIGNMNEGDTLLFKSMEYNFAGRSLTISKAITVTGSLPDQSTSDKQGAYDVNTVFKDIKSYKLTSSDIVTENIELSADASVSYVFTNVSHAQDGTKYYTGLVFKNVIFRYGRVQCFGRNGAGIEFTNVSFVDFTLGGYYLNRHESIDSAPQFKMSKCFFKPDFDAVNFNVRAISLDAGNTEYPVVWNQNDSVIDNCLMDGTGLGISSKCSYVNVTNCHFKGYRMDVDMIHIEEFGHHFVIDGNTFEHIKPARGINIDREIQQCHDITITNNKWLGEYGWIISAHSPYNLVMENNDFTEAWAKSTNDKTIDFTYDHGEEVQFTEYDLPAKNIVFKNNTGLDNGKHGFFAYKALDGETSLDIDYPADKIQAHTIDEEPQTILDNSTYYRIRNKDTGEYLHTRVGQSELELSEGEKADSTDVWEFTFEYPFFYHVKNRATKKYMEVYRGYTLGDYTNGTQDQIIVEQTDFFNSKADKPRWYLRKHDEGGSIYYEILPGGNERKSRNVQVGKYMELEFAKIANKGQLPPEDDSSWVLEPLRGSVTSVKKGLGMNDLHIYPNPVDKQFKLYAEGYQGSCSITIFSTAGKMLLRSEVEVKAGLKNHFDVSSLTRGTYIVQLLGSNINMTQKLLVN